MSEAKQTIIEQFGEHGRAVTGVYDLKVRDGGGALGTLAAFTGGGLSAERLEIVTATGPFGPECVVVPFDGHSVLPGEYHLTLPGALRTPVEYLRRLGGTWNAGDDTEMASWMKKQKFPTHRLPDELQQGFTKTKLPKVFQLAPIGPQQSALVYTLGGNHTMINLEPYVEVAAKLGGAIAGSTGPGPLAPLGEIRYGAVVAAALAGELDVEAAPSPAPPDDGEARLEEPAAVGSAVDMTERLRATLSPLVGKRVLIAPIDDKTLGNITKKVAADAVGADIVAFLDTGARAAGKAGLAFMAGSVHIAELSKSWTIAYGDIRSFSLRKRKVTLDSSVTGEITFDAYGVEDAMIPALETVTGLAAQ